MPDRPNRPRAACWLCGCGTRRQFTAMLAAGAGAVAHTAAAQGADGVQSEVGRNSRFTRLVSAEQVEAGAAGQYLQLVQGAASARALAPAAHPQLVRLRAIAQRIIPFAPPWNARATRWRWEVNLLGSPEINAFCMPGGKIAFHFGILHRLQLGDDEVAAIMGHEMAHALREHARERIGKQLATRGAIELGAALLGLGNTSRAMADIGGQLLSLQFSRSDETEADLVGLDLAARAGYDPAAGVTLWQKMMAVQRGAPPQFLSTHPAGETRIRDIQAKLPRVQPLYERAERPPQRYAPPPASSPGARARTATPA